MPWLGSRPCVANLVTFPLDAAKIQGEAKLTGKGRYKGVFGPIATMVRTRGTPWTGGRAAAADELHLHTREAVRLHEAALHRRGRACREGGHGYQGIVDAYRTITKEEGGRGLWRGGMSPNIIHSAMVNCAELVSYNLIKDHRMGCPLKTDNLPCCFASGFGAGFCATLVASPMDAVKMRYVNTVLGQHGSGGSCALALLRNEGPEAFYKQFASPFLQLGSWKFMIFVTYEQLKQGLMATRGQREVPS
ncbi:PREDICTED: LOW QUALITY PROTEIN: mitochondrial uncoupling protein 2-like [Charadrius vociferus]|uniref:LOW QUALITY PROTEIN: mitochondrial uncoupling protein 2-like n=1 Tax=Charadrius vociferus TaxID=50402 RepID=UPI0005218457|nr:PREDICTED: LOW QUALITY PROTEIN: mitochondrial uncoupling protein 2-like [Charadrius vociferus]